MTQKPNNPMAHTPNIPMKITILGSGTSTGVPVIGCQCEVCLSHNPKNKRLRTSALVQTESASLLIDCSADFREQALRNKIARIDGLLMTHTHSDHISGLDDLRIYNYLQGEAIKIFSAPHILEEIRKRFDYCFNPTQIGGGVPELELIPVDGSFEFMGIKITPLPVKHGDLPILGYRFNDFTYVTDASFIPEETMQKMMGTRVLVLNALRYMPHSTHYSLAEALEISQRIGPERVWFTHIAHQMEHWATNRTLPPNARLAYDGLVIEI